MSNVTKQIKKYKQLLLPLFTFAIFLSVLVQLHGVPFVTNAQTAGTAIFGSVGDSGGSSNANAVFTAAKSANLNFFVHVGDLSYGEQGGASGWSTWIKGIFGDVYPFEIVSGNHDNGDIAVYAQGLPNKMAGMQGTYAQNYYFDYPQTSPLVRIIMTSPGIFDPDTAWLTTAIDSARSANIPWVVAGMHKNCITTGQKSCEMGAATLDLLLSKKVDLILQGHDHNYQRSKQLTCAKADTFDQTCVANAGPAYKKGAGSIIVINGAGGNGFYGINTSDSEAGYFAKINSDTYGFTKLTLTASQLSSEFVRTGGGSLTDSFTIAGTGGTPVSPPAAQPSTGSQPITPSFVVIAPCPSCAAPTVPSVNGGTTPPASEVVNPSEPLVNPSSSPDPCVAENTSIADDNSRGRHGHHRKHAKGGIGNMMDGFLQLLMEIINKLIELLGGSPIQTPSTPTDPTVPDPADPADPCGAVPSTDPASQPSVAPEISQ
jgi:hypothetical protein